MTRGRFITVEGIEGAGKSTLLQGLADACAHVASWSAPRANRVARRWPRTSAIWCWRGAREGMPPATELLLMFAARASHVAQRIEPSLARGEWVLCDRFTDASRAYQGGGRGMDAAEHRVAGAQSRIRASHRI